MKMTGSARVDRFNDAGILAAPSVGIVVRPTEQPIRLRATYAYNYRVPSFNEQYYLNVGNANLDPERSTSLNLGATWQPLPTVMIESSLFRIDTKDKIITIPLSPVRWSTRNVGRTVTRGVEIAGAGSVLDGALRGSVSYSLMEAVDRSGGLADGHTIPYTPDEQIDAMVTGRMWGALLTGTFEYSSHRQTLSYNTPEGALPRYALFGLSLTRPFEIDRVEVSPRIGIDNIADTDYQVIRGYPMPGRSCHISVSATYTIDD
jgi:outer membrane cobalamin receptor